MRNLFNSVKMTRPSDNLFDLSHDVKLSCNMGELVPIMIMECVPGDKVNMQSEVLARFAPLVAPTMHRFNLTTHYFFVPNRILWPEWEEFITNGNGTDPLPVMPYVQVNGSTYSRLLDYMGIPTPIGGEMEEVSALPLAAYFKVWYEYYRDQNLQTGLEWNPLVSGLNSIYNWNELMRRAWQHDYFTSALPFAQKGDPVEIPIGSQKVILDPDSLGDPGEIKAANTHAAVPGVNLSTDVVGALQGDPATEAVYDPAGTLKTEDSGEATTINDLRRAFKLQEWLEKMARGGSRMIEVILAHFGVRSSDKRLQRPEYITGTVTPIQISEVLNTTGDTGAADPLPQGNMAGHGVAFSRSNGGHYFCEEHGYVIGIMSITPVTAYQQGIEKHWLKKDPTDYYWPSFANIGEQPILNKELYAFQGADGNETFGYIPRYAEYKFLNSRVAGDFRGNLSYWHAGRIFETIPQLNEDFIKCDPTTRIFAVEDPDVQKMYCHVLNRVKALRRMPKYGTPTF